MGSPWGHREGAVLEPRWGSGDICRVLPRGIPMPTGRDAREIGSHRANRVLNSNLGVPKLARFPAFSDQKAS